MLKKISLILALLAYSASAFVVPDTPVVAVPQAVVVTQDAVRQQVGQSSPLQDGIRNYVASPFEESTTLTLSLKERPPPPTKEELAAKKRNFNLWFWGGGFVAPFLATFYYFGFKFWER
jgi:parvulin-like peptidyl-prolyl isomerase